MSSRFEVGIEPAYSNSYNWRSSSKLKFDEPDETNVAQKSVGKLDMSYSIRTKSPVAFSNSSSLTRSVDLFSPSAVYDVNSHGNEMHNGRAKSPGFTSTGSHVLTQSLSMADTSSGGRKMNNELTSSIDLGSYTVSQPSSSYNNYQKTRPKTAAAVASKGDDRIKNRPPVAPGRPRPQPSDTLPRSGTAATHSTAAYNRTGDTDRYSSLSNDKRTLHSSINSLDNMRHVDHQQLYDKHSTVRASSTNFSLDRPWSRSSDVGPLSHLPSGSSFETPREKDPSANGHKSLLSESRPKSALAGSLSRLERSGTSLKARSYADRSTPGFETRDKSSSLRRSTDMNLGSSYDEIIKRLRKMETQTNSENLIMKPDIATDHKALESESVPHRSSDYLTNNIFTKKPTYEYSIQKATDEFSDTDDLIKDSSVYNRNSARNKDKFQYKDERKPLITGDTTAPSDTYKTYPDLSSRTGERTSAYSKNGAIESWLRSVTTDSSDVLTGSLHDDKNAFQDSHHSGSDHLEHNVSAKQNRSTKTYDLSNGYDEKVLNQPSREFSGDSYRKATSPKQSLAKKGGIAFTNSTYDVDNTTRSTRRDFDSDLTLAKQDRDRTDLRSYDPNTRSDSRLSLLRKYLDQADSVGAQKVSSAVDNGYLKLPNELGMDDLRRSTSSFDHRTSTHLDSSSFRKMSADLSYLGNSPKPVYTTTTLTRTPSTEAFSHKDLYNGISSSRDKLDSYQTTSSKGKRQDDPTLSSERQFENSNGYSFNALTTSMDRPRSPTRNFSETITDKRYDTFGHNSEQTRLESEREKDNSYRTISFYNKKKPSYSSTELSTSYGKADLSDDGKAEKKKRDSIDLQLTGGYADSRTLLKILEKNRKYRTVSSADSNENPEVKYTSRATADLVNANSGVATTRDFSNRSHKDQTRIEDELSKVRSSSDFSSSLGHPKRVWYSEEHLAPSTNDADNDISVRFDYKPDTFRYVLRKDTLESALDSTPISNGAQDSSARVRRWRSDLALFGDNLEIKDPSATSFDSRNSGLTYMRSSSFRDTKEAKTPERRQVKWQDEVLFDKASGESSIAMNTNDASQGNMFLRKERDVSPSPMLFTPLSERLRPTERNDIAPVYSTDLVESQSLHQSLRSQSPYSKSFLASTWSGSGRENDDRESKLKQIVNGVDPNPTSLYEGSSNHRPSSSLYENLRSLSPSFKSKGFLASSRSTSGKDEDRERKQKQTANGGEPNPTSIYESSPGHRPSGSMYDNSRSQSPSFESKSFLASKGVDSNPASLHENPSNYRPSYRPSSRLSSTSYTYTDQDPLTTNQPSNASLNDTYTVISTTTQSKTPTIDPSTYNHQTPINDSITTKTSAYLSTDSVYTSSYSPTRYTSTSLPNHADTHSDNIAGNYATQNSVLKAERGQTASPYSSLEIENFLSSRSARKSTNDLKQPEDVLHEKWRPGTSASGVSNNYRHLLSSSNYADSTSYKDSSHLASASLPYSSATGSRRGSLTLSKPNRGDDASVPLKPATKYPHDTDHLTSSLPTSKDTAAKDYSTAGLPYKYLSYHVAPSSNGSSANTFAQPYTRLSDPYSGIGHRERLSSSGSTSRDDLRHLHSNSLTNGVSTGADFLSGMADKHDDGMSLVSETEFVVMRSGDIVKRPFKKSDRSDAHNQSHYSKTHSSARIPFR